MTPANIGAGGGGCQPPRYRVARGPDAGGGPGGGEEVEREIKERECVSYGERARERESKLSWTSCPVSVKFQWIEPPIVSPMRRYFVLTVRIR